MVTPATLEAALAYEAAGLSVIPLHAPTADGCTCRQGTACTSRGKHTIVAWKEYQTRRASPDEIRAWWSRWPWANVGIVTGVVSRLAVVDIDPRNGGFETLVELDARGAIMPDTNPVVVTGSGGLHHYLSLTTPLPKAAPFQGIELQADGALVVAPPSRHASGRLYRWARPLESPRPPVPAWLLWAVEQTLAPAPAATLGPIPDAVADDVLGALHAAGLYLAPHRRAGMHRIRCPWADEHSNGDVEAVVIEPGASPAPGWAFKCLHAHCSERHIGDLLDVLGLARRRTAA